MELAIISKTENALLKQEILKVKVTYTTEKTPSRAQILDALAKKLGKEPDCLAIVSIQASFGASDAQVLVHMYPSKKDLEHFEAKPIQTRHAPKEKKA